MCECNNAYFGDQCRYNHSQCICPPNHECGLKEGTPYCYPDVVPSDALVIEGLGLLPIVSMNQVINTLDKGILVGIKLTILDFNNIL